MRLIVLCKNITKETLKITWPLKPSSEKENGCLEWLHLHSQLAREHNISLKHPFESGWPPILEH